MESQTEIKTPQVVSTQDTPLIQLIMSTYHNRSSEDIRIAQAQIGQMLQNPSFVYELTTILLSPEHQQNLKTAVANIIRKFSSEYSRRNQDKSKFIETLYNLIMQRALSFKIREVLSVALQYQFNADQNNLYRNIVRDRVMLMLQNQQNIQYFDGSLMVCYAFLNSLVQGQQRMDFMLMIIREISYCGVKMHRLITNMNEQQWNTKDRFIMPILEKLFQFIEVAVERLDQQKDMFKEEMDAFRNNSYLITLFQSYLLLFHNNYSIISTSYPQINSLKSTIMGTIALLFSQNLCPQRIFQTTYLTFLSECHTIVTDIQIQQILVQCINLMREQFTQKNYHKVFYDNKMQTVFALFMYSASNQQQYDYMQEQPQRFAGLAQEYTQGSPKSTYLKVQAGGLIRTLTSMIDQLPQNIMEILMVIIAGSLEVDTTDSEIMAQVKNQFSKFNFYGLTPWQKLQTAFMVLSAISGIIKNSMQKDRLIFGFLFTQFETLVKIQTPIVVLRFIRLISYFPAAIYFMYIQAQMKKGGVFIVQGLKALQRILKTNKFAQIFPFLGEVLRRLLGVIRISDPVMELIIINFFDKVLQKVPQLYTACLSKIHQQFLLNVGKNQHSTIICFNLIYSLMKKQTSQQMLSKIQKQFYLIIAHLSTKQLQTQYQRYFQNIVEIMMIILQKQIQVSQQVRSFAQNGIRHLHYLQKGTKMFAFYNKFFIKSSCTMFSVVPYYQHIWGQIKRRHALYMQTSTQPDVIAYLCFLASQILANQTIIIVSPQDLQQLLSMTDSLSQQHKQYTLGIFFTYLFYHPYPVIKFLKDKGLYNNFMLYLRTVQFQGRIMKKIFMLAMVKMLQIQQNQQVIGYILLFCIDHMKKSISGTRQRLSKLSQAEIKPRRLGQQRRHEAQNRMLNLINDNQLVNLFGKFKHPMDALSEYDMFKIIFWQNDQLANRLQESVKNDLRVILQTQWVENKTRQIIRVKRQ